MGLEATIVCVDNSEWMRNGDFIPSRLHAQQDAVNVVCRMKTKLNLENAVGLMTLADTQVRVTLTNDLSKIFKALQQLEPKGKVNFITGLRIAHLALKHRQNKNQKMKIVAFIGSPVEVEEKELMKLAKRLKKEKVTVDIVNFGEAEANTDKLTTFIDTINGKDKTNHLITTHPGPMLSDVLLSSPILADEDGAPLAPMGQGFEFGIDPTEDPELAMALRVSMEEQRQRQEEEARRVQHESLTQVQQEPSDEGGLAQAGMADLPYNPDLPTVTTEVTPDISALTEEEQLALALQMSMQAGSGMLDQPMETESAAALVEPLSTDGATQTQEEEGDVGEEGDIDDDADMEELMQNREFLESVLSTLPGVNPEEALQNLQQMAQAQQEQQREGEEEGDGEDHEDK